MRRSRGYFFEHSLRSFSKALRSLQWKLGGEASLVSFDEELVLVVVPGHRGSANVCIKLVHGAEARTLVGSIDAERDDAARVVLDTGIIRVDAGSADSWRNSWRSSCASRACC